MGELIELRKAPDVVFTHKQVVTASFKPGVVEFHEDSEFGVLTVRLWCGRAFTHTWRISSTGHKTFASFLARTGADYISHKLWGGARWEPDGKATRAAMLRGVVDARRVRAITADQARETWDDIEIADDYRFETGDLPDVPDEVSECPYEDFYRERKPRVLLDLEKTIEAFVPAWRQAHKERS